MKKRKSKVEKRSVRGIVIDNRIENKILLLRGKRVMLDRDLALLYGVSTGNLNKAVQRNVDRFPEDFMFQLNQKEVLSLRFQIGISSLVHGGRRYLPYVFTQEGVAMLSSVLKSQRAVYVNLSIMRAFVRFKEVFSFNKELKRRLEDLNQKFGNHQKEIQTIWRILRQLMDPPAKKNKLPIGFCIYKEQKKHG